MLNRVVLHQKGRDYYLQKVPTRASRHDGSIVWDERLEWVAKEKDGTKFEAEEAKSQAGSFGARVVPCG